MIKELILLVTVLAITVFLASCAPAVTTRPEEHPFNYDLMRTAEATGKNLGKIVTWSGYDEYEGTGKNDRGDLAWAKYYAGQVALAAGRNTEAEEYFREADEMLKVIIKEIKTELEAALPVPGQGL